MALFNLRATVEVYYTIEANSLEEAKEQVRQELKNKDLNESFTHIEEEE